MSASEQACEVALLEYAYGELAPAEAAEVERHVAGCAGCAQALEGMRGVRRVMAQLPEEPPEAGLDSLLAYAEQSARRAAAGPAPSPGTWRRWLAPLLGVGALATLAFIALPVAEQARVPLPSSVAARVVESDTQGRAAPAPGPQAAVRGERAQADLRTSEEAPSLEKAGAAAEDADEGALLGSAARPPARAVAPQRANVAPSKGGASAGWDEGLSPGALGTGRGGLAGGGGAALQVAEAGPRPTADRSGPAPALGDPVRRRAKEAKQEFAREGESGKVAEAAPAAPPPALMDGLTEVKKAAAPEAKVRRETVAARDTARAWATASESDEEVLPVPLAALRRAVGEAKGPAERQAALRRLCDAERATNPASTPGCEQLAREFPADGGLSR